MKKLSPTTLGLTLAIALSAGGVLVEHPLYTDPAPRTYSDITIAETDYQKAPPESAYKPVTPPAQTSTSEDSSARGEDVSVDRDPAPRVPKVDKP
jgi:hypothetical protein